MKVKEYTKDGLVVVWKPEVCIHSEKCFKGLPEVFNPSNKPWINMEGASLDQIRSQVGKCPSGALSIKESDESSEEATIVEVSVNGPLLLKGKTQVILENGVIHKRDNTTALCRCGASANKPFCDGSHKKIDFKG